MMKLLLSLFFTCSLAQDPAEGWMAYAVGALPSSVLRITRLEMTWQVGAAPARSYAFFSPWFGMDPLDNLNLIQPVNPWGGRSWSMYTEYYQWRPSHNSNSIQKPVLSGQTLKGSLVYDASSDSYELSQTVLETGVTSSQVVPCQNGKKFLVPYIVYEKVFPCRSYPPDGVVTFRNITMECETASAASVDCKNLVTWSAQYKDVCPRPLPHLPSHHAQATSHPCCASVSPLSLVSQHHNSHRTTATCVRTWTRRTKFVSHGTRVPSPSTITIPRRSSWTSIPRLGGPRSSLRRVAWQWWKHEDS